MSLKNKRASFCISLKLCRLFPKPYNDRRLEFFPMFYNIYFIFQVFILVFTTTNLFAMTRISQNELGRLRDEWKWRNLLLIQSLASIPASFLTPKDFAQNCTRIVITLRSCSTPSLTVSTDLKSLKVIISLLNAPRESFAIDAFFRNFSEICRLLGHQNL